jgi:cytochrome c-type biogenesis protein CcmH/NrfG
MARGAAKQRPRAQAEARPRAARKPPVAEQTMFFMRLRRSTKPIFLFLAIVFAITFVALGVGSGGSGLDQLFNGIVGRSSSKTSVGKAQDRLKKNPNDAGAYHDLARAYEAKGDDANAIGALQNYLRLKPKDTAVLGEVAALYLSQAEAARAQAAAAQAKLTGGAFVTPPVSGALASAAGQNPLNEASTGGANEAFTAAYQKMQSAYGSAVEAYKKVAAATPKDPTVQLRLADAAETAGDSKTAIAAYKRFLKLAPDDPSAPVVRQRIKLLRSQAAPTG